MRSVWGILVVAAIIMVVLAGAPSDPGQQRPEYELRTEGRLLVFEQPGYRSIYVRPEAISGYVVWQDHPQFEEVVFLNLGAKEYRLDVSSAEKLDELEQFLLKHGAP